ncbi:hypothetical protein SB5439_05134 [Klebsiella variicola]|uniref:type II toxin-antitoxin system Phd/YefM family antitoxin n=1 Tax=Klebsiella variicola TaxID=244366 RepID=UPI00109C2A59|nr:type II toxin-antitoxin system prevent-host-death family antitoxin [Klebsiella variicola]VGQ13053.1 hypothetical protein SB5439_05134 [Klebsiella variicola]
MSTRIYARKVASIADLKNDPMEVMDAAKGEPVAIVNDGTAVFYCVPAEAYARALEMLEDLELAAVAKERLDDARIEVRLDDL